MEFSTPWRITTAGQTLCGFSPLFRFWQTTRIQISFLRIWDRCNTGAELLKRIRVYRTATGLGSDELHILARMGNVDYFLDSQTALPVALALDIHSDSDFGINIPVLIVYSNYTSISGIQVPFQISKAINGTTVLQLSSPLSRPITDILWYSIHSHNEASDDSVSPIGLCFTIIAIMATSPLTAQQPTVGFLLSTTSSGAFDTVNLSNLDVHFSIPVFARTGKGMSFAFALTYDSLVWSPSDASGGRTCTYQLGWGVQTNAATGYMSLTTVPTNCHPHGIKNRFGFLYYDVNGTSHTFPANVTPASILF